ncbi:FAD-dependent oxidoreductase [Cryptosporangium sp. NPDC048952]|uniref:FAD-dependent oxidoreductase n=1 Tax=Cryptosporangium sp. NPDC048952 TaxID=3363961 RepID=UPI003710B4D2
MSIETPAAPYPTLLSPLKLGPRTARNRTWMTAHSTHLVKGNTFSQEHIDYYVERAKGGTAVITMEAMAVHPTTQPYEGMRVHAFEETVVEPYKQMKAALAEHDTLVMAQLWHRGRQTHGVVSRLPVWAPSAVPCGLFREIPHEMTHADIDEIVEHYVRSARYAVEGGLDGVEIHGVTHGYLLGQFLSPATNHRRDEYGGSLENRMRIVLRILDQIREIVPATMILGMRISGDEGLENGLGNAEWVEIASRLAATDKLDYLSVTQGNYLDRMKMYMVPPGPRGYQVDATANIKRAVGDLPVVVVGRITTPDQAEDILSAGKADFIGMARQLITEPNWLNKAAAGKANTIRPCVGANWCLSTVMSTRLACAHNPAVGVERKLGTGTLTPAEHPKEVVVVGGGLAGLRAAYTASKRGHSVVLFEGRSELGGQVNLLRGTSYEEYVGMTDWLIERIAESDVKVRLNEWVSGDDWYLPYDHVVLAAGADFLKTGISAVQPFRWQEPGTEVRGMDQFNVFTVEETLRAKRGDIAHRAVVFDDTGTREPMIAAEQLARSGHPVRYVTRLNQVGPDLAGNRDQGPFYSRLRKLGVEFTTRTIIDALDGDELTLRDLDTDETFVWGEVDALVVSTGKAARTGLAAQLERVGFTDASVVGDCLAPRRFFNATWEAELAARAI